MVANPHGGLSRSGRHESFDVVNYIAEKSFFLTCSSKDAIFFHFWFSHQFQIFSDNLHRVGGPRHATNA